MTDLFANTTFIKICGVTTVTDARLVVDAHATAIGLIFATSPRHVSAERGREIARSVTGVGVVGVFRDNSRDFILTMLDQVPVDAVQIHGALDERVLGELRGRGLGVIKALSIGEGAFHDFDDTTVDAVLVDGPSPGSGDAHSWDDLASRSFSVPLIVAGGLNASNVATVKELTAAWGVDVASGVESAPGVKDRGLVLNFVNAARRAHAQGVDRGD